MKSSPKLRLDSLWWISVPYLIALPSLFALLIVFTGATGWELGHFLGVFILLGIPLACISGGWTIAITYRVLVSHSVDADRRTMTMLCLAALVTLAWGSYAVSGWVAGGT